jgi:hypothetical protein
MKPFCLLKLRKNVTIFLFKIEKSYKTTRK